MFRFIKKMSSELLSAGTLGIFGKSLAFNSKVTLKLVSLNNEPCQTRPTVVNIDSDETLFFIYLLFMLLSAIEFVTLLMISLLEFVF